jgi:hypothetical protein
MTFDYGQRTRIRIGGPAKAALAIGLLAGLGVTAAVIGGSLGRARVHAQADQATYGAVGPPCPEAAPERLRALGVLPRHDFDYTGLKLSYAFGGVDCAEFSGPGGLFGIGAPRVSICRFTSPGGLRLRDHGRDRLFATGLGRPAAVVMAQGRVRCVLTSRELG